MTVQQLDIAFPTASPINIERFGKQNKIVADRLLSGESINVVTAMKQYGIYHLHSRIADVRREFKKYGIIIYSRMITVGDMQCKEYRLKPFIN